MKAVKLIGLYRAPHFFAISLLLVFIAARWGFASSCARSYEIAPMCSHILIVFISSVCLIISSFIFSISVCRSVLDFKGRRFILQGKTRFFSVFSRFFFKNSPVFAFFEKSHFGSFSAFFLLRAVLTFRAARKRLGKRLGKRLENRLGNG